MAYKFNSGRGGVICDQCRVLFDVDLSLAEYEKIYSKNDGDFCWRCKTGYKDIKECRNCGSTEFNSEGNCIYCKQHIDKKHI